MRLLFFSSLIVEKIQCSTLVVSGWKISMLQKQSMNLDLNKGVSGLILKCCLSPLYIASCNVFIVSLKSGLQNPERGRWNLYFNLWFVISGIWSLFCYPTWYKWGTIHIDCSNARVFSTYFQYFTYLTLILHFCISSLSLPFPFPHSSQVCGL